MVYLRIKSRLICRSGKIHILDKKNFKSAIHIIQKKISLNFASTVKIRVLKLMTSSEYMKIRVLKLLTSQPETYEPPLEVPK